jgi:NADH-quinone oxidoreductase subunit M
MPILTLLIFLPILGMIIISMISEKRKDVIRSTTFGVTAINFIACLSLLFGFDSSTHEMQFVEKVRWIPDIGVTYLLGIDGLSLLLLLLTTFIAMIGVLCSWSAINDFPSIWCFFFFSGKSDWFRCIF